MKSSTLPAFYVLFLNSFPGNISIFCITFTSHFLNTVFLLGSLKFHIFFSFLLPEMKCVIRVIQATPAELLPLVHIHHLYVWHVAAKAANSFPFPTLERLSYSTPQQLVAKEAAKAVKNSSVHPTHGEELAQAMEIQIIDWFVAESQTCVPINSFFTCLHRSASVNDRGKTGIWVYIRCGTKVDFILPLSLTQDTGCR